MTTDTEKRLADLVKQLRAYAACQISASVGEHEDICTQAADAIDRLTAERDAAWVDGRDAAAQVADMYAEENIEMAGDSVLTDPCLSGKGFTPENIKTSESRMIDGCIHSSMYHAATNIAAAIRALSPSTLNKPE